jgi:hypothetical protein
MLHDRDLLDRLSAFSPLRFDGEVFRATRRGLDPLAPSVTGGRWMLPDHAPTLYTSEHEEGALAEIVYHWSQQTPLPSKPVVLHTLGLKTLKTLRLARADLAALGVDWQTYGSASHARTQAIGAAIAHLEMDGLIAPSARWACNNIILYLSNHSVSDDGLVIRSSREVDWQMWAADHAGTMGTS